MALTQPATIRYGRIQWNDATAETLAMEARPQYDASGRTVIYIVYTITIKAIVSVSNIGGFEALVGLPPAALMTTDAFYNTARQELTRPGQLFFYQDNGFGDFTLNVGGGGDKQDVVWGPKPRMLQWKPLGAQYSSEMVWTVEVAIPECANAKFAGVNNWMEFCFGVDYTVDGGYTTRSINGFLRVPQTRGGVNVRTLAYTADQARELIYQPPIAGFRRMPATFKLSQDKCRLDFTFVDQQAGPNYPPQGVVDVQATQTVESGTFWGGMLSGLLTATYEIAQGLPYDRSDCLDHFLALLQQKQQAAAAIRFAPDLTQPGVKEAAQKANLFKDDKLPGSFFLLRRLQMSEPIYDRKAGTVTASWSFLASIKQIQAGSAIWEAVPGNNDNRWMSSMIKNGVWTPRGYAGLKFNAKDDVIIDLCEPVKPPAAPAPAPAAWVPPGGGRVGAGFERRRKPPPSQSWLHYFAQVFFTTEDNTVAMMPLQEEATLLRESAGLIGLETGGGVSGGGVSKLDVGGPPQFSGNAAADSAAPQFAIPSTQPVIQIRCGSVSYVQFAGWAMRAGYPVPAPKLASIAGITPVPANRADLDGFRSGLMASYFGVPVYIASWSLRYVVRGLPDGDFSPPNPFLGA
jgi:hypothetical protein